MVAPKFVPVDAHGKSGPPPLPNNLLAYALCSQHLGDFVVLHTDGAEAYRNACKRLQGEGCRVVHDYVVHSRHQYTAFGRHDVSGFQGWDQCEFAIEGPTGERRIRVIKGTEKIEGWWRHLKHGSGGVPKEVGNDDRRLNAYCQCLVWRSQTCGCPYRDVLRMCRAFRFLPLAQKTFVYEHGLKLKGGVIRTLPPVTYISESAEPIDKGGGSESDGEEETEGQ